MAEILLDLVQVEASQEEIRQHLVGGQALAKFEELIQAQGGDLTDLYRHSSAPVVTDIHAHETGYIKELPVRHLENCYAIRSRSSYEVR